MTRPLVVLGAGGKLGRLLAPAWPGDVVQYTRAAIDIQDKPALQSALRGAGAVLCLAGATNGSRWPMALNETVASLTLDAAQSVQCGRVFLMSSAAVYGRSSALLSETTPPAPLTTYARSKLRMEQLAAAHPHPNTVLRLGNVAGADAILGGWRPGFMLDVLADGTTPKRSYVGPKTLAHTFTTLAAADTVPALVNIATPAVLHMGDLLDAAGRTWTARHSAANVIAQVVLNTTILSRFMSWTSEMCTASGMVREWQEVTGGI